MLTDKQAQRIEWNMDLAVKVTSRTSKNEIIIYVSDVIHFLLQLTDSTPKQLDPDMVRDYMIAYSQSDKFVGIPDDYVKVIIERTRPVKPLRRYKTYEERYREITPKPTGSMIRDNITKYNNSVYPLASLLHQHDEDTVDGSILNGLQPPPPPPSPSMSHTTNTFTLSKDKQDNEDDELHDRIFGKSKWRPAHESRKVGTRCSLSKRTSRMSI